MIDSELKARGTKYQLSSSSVNLGENIYHQQTLLVGQALTLLPESVPAWAHMLDATDQTQPTSTVALDSKFLPSTLAGSTFILWAFNKY